MSKRPKFDELEQEFEKGVEFYLTDCEYEMRTGAKLPKSNWYLTKNSAIANKAKEYGFIISDIVEKSERTICFRKGD